MDDQICIEVMVQLESTPVSLETVFFCERILRGEFSLDSLRTVIHFIR
jgi:hypothetical protein